MPEAWPAPSNEIASGWAGGLGPDNVLEEAKKIAAKSHAAYPHWIDMETKLRSSGDDYFCLGKCRSVLQQIKPFVTIN